MCASVWSCTYYNLRGIMQKKKLLSCWVHLNYTQKLFKDFEKAYFLDVSEACGLK